MSFLVALSLIIGIVSGVASLYEIFKSHKLPATIYGVMAGGMILAAILISIIPTPPGSGNNKPGNVPTSTISSLKGTTATAVPIPSPAVTPTEAATPTSSATGCPTPIAETPTPTPVGTVNPSVTAVVSMQGCPPAKYSVLGVFGFYTGGAYNEVGVYENSESFLSFGNGYMGSISLLGLSPESAYHGPPLYAWLCGFTGGGYAIVISNTVAQPTQLQLGNAVQYSGYVDVVVGSYLPSNYKLVSTTPQPGGAQGYQFNLVVKNS